MHNQQTADQANSSDLQNVFQALQGQPNCSIANFEKAALAFWNLVQTYETTPDANVKSQLGQLFSLLGNADPLIGGRLGSFLYAALKGQGRTDQQIQSTMHTFLTAHPDVKNMGFEQNLIAACGYGANGNPPDITQIQLALSGELRQVEDSVKNLMSAMQQMASLQSNAANSLAQQIKDQKQLEYQLRNGFPIEALLSAIKKAEGKK